ncbi:MAG: hypothetical protein LUH36_01255 [Oscillospiraceae bacterium]|nr:hypothetical protein [Oscillospiraceae bacterium]
MKKFLALCCGLAMLLGLTACGGFVSIMPGASDGTEEDVTASISPQLGQTADEDFTEKSFYVFMGWDELGESYYEDTPVALSCREGDGSVSPVFDRASIIAACDALKDMTVTGRAEEDAAQEGTGYTYTLTMSDGTAYSVTFNGSVLTTYTGSYTYIGGEALFALTFPVYDSSYDLFDLYFDDGVRAFADEFEENLPVSVGRRTNGGATMTATDEETIRTVFSLLAGATVTGVESNPDQNINLTTSTDYIFTMSDGTTYTFTFTDSCLTVTTSSDYGPVYYWLSGTEALAYISIVPQTETEAFEGGLITGLREDFQTAADAAAGNSDLTVSGVYVSYSIDGQSGYLTLSGDTAVSFVQAVTAMTVTGESQTEADGDTITISVTLSDGSGPILYFIGDTIQQVVGTYYVCDSGSMSTLRTTVQSLAADGGNTGEVVEDSTN